MSNTVTRVMVGGCGSSRTSSYDIREGVVVRRSPFDGEVGVRCLLVDCLCLPSTGEARRLNRDSVASPRGPEGLPPHS